MYDPLPQHREVRKIKVDIDAIETLIKSRGWAILKEALDGEEEAAIRSISEKPTIEREVLDFNRAALRAVRLLAKFPESILGQFKAELKLAEAVESAKKPLTKE